jgi:hypothetical protein
MDVICLHSSLFIAELLYTSNGLNYQVNFVLVLVCKAKNAYIFTGFGLGVVMSGAVHVHDDILRATCKYY